MKYVDIDGKRYTWRDILKARREQKKAERQQQPVLFELRDDTRPEPERTAAGRFVEPSLPF